MILRSDQRWILPVEPSRGPDGSMSDLRLIKLTVGLGIPGGDSLLWFRVVREPCEDSWDVVEAWKMKTLTSISKQSLSDVTADGATNSHDQPIRHLDTSSYQIRMGDKHSNLLHLVFQTTDWQFFQSLSQDYWECEALHFCCSTASPHQCSV